jgi:putative sterol carrier protein
MSEETFVNVIAEGQNPASAFFTGELAIEGDLMYAVKLDKYRRAG